jgi:outer membrane protein TolC
LKGAIEQDVQDALLDLKAAAQQVDVATTGLELAKQTLAQSQDRFAAGVTNNVEVIQAQQQLASANDQYIASLYEHNIAKVLLARAIGNAEQLAKQYLADTGNATTSPNVNQNPQAPSPNTTTAPNPQAPQTPRP